MREGPDGDKGTKRGLLMVASQGMMDWLGTGEGGLEAVRTRESGLETRWKGGRLVNRGGWRR